MMSDLAKALVEKSKDDRAMIVGSEIRGAIQELTDEIERLRGALTLIASLARS